MNNNNMKMDNTNKYTLELLPKGRVSHQFTVVDKNKHEFTFNSMKELKETFECSTSYIYGAIKKNKLVRGCKIVIK